MDNLKLSHAEARAWARAEAKAGKQSGASMHKTGMGFVFWMLLVGVVLVSVFTYLPGQLDPAYGHNGQVVNMVQPQGDNPDADQQYAEHVNLPNSEANINNAKAYQRQSVVWMGWVFCLTGLGFVMVVFKWLTRAAK